MIRSSRWSGTTLGPFVPLLFFLLAPPGTVPAAAQAVRGLVFDDVGNAPVAGAEVTLLLPDGLGVEARTTADGGGRFRLRAESGSYLLVATAPGFAASAPREVDLAPGDGVDVLVSVRRLKDGGILIDESASEAEGARLFGRVVEAGSGRPIESVEVRLEGLDLWTLSDAEGHFVFREVPPGPARLRLVHLGYGEQERLVVTRPGRSYQVEAELAPEAVELEGIEVAVRGRSWFRRMDEVRWRMARGMGGQFLLAADLERRGHPPLNAALRSLRSVRLEKVPGDPFDERITIRNCEASLWIDGIRVYDPVLDRGDHVNLMEFLTVPSVDVEAVEVYAGPSTLPPEFGGANGGCAVVVWTKR